MGSLGGLVVGSRLVVSDLGHRSWTDYGKTRNYSGPEVRFEEAWGCPMLLSL
jgi:hypothetical protein